MDLRFFPRLAVVVIAAAAAFIPPTLAGADPISPWTARPDAIGDNTYQGFVDVPATNATVPTGTFTVAGWFVDSQAAGWSGADDVEIWQGSMDGGGKLLVKASFAQNRPDVGSALGNPYWAASGFSGVVPAGALTAGAQTLSVYAHTPAKGWWFKQVQVNVSGSATAVAAPIVSGGSPPVLALESPNQGTSFTTKVTFDVIGYALDPNSAPHQGSQGSGIDQVSVYADAPREDNGVFLGNADLGFSDAAAVSKYGSQFANSGWRFTAKPTGFHSGVHNLFIYAHSAVTGKENLVTLGFSVIERS